MQSVVLNEVSTLLIGLIALLLGRFARQATPFLRQIDMPNAVIGGLMVALVVLLLHVFVDLDVRFGTALRDSLLLVFFAAIGLSAKFAALRHGGFALILLCGVTLLALIAQNASGSLLAALWGAHPAYGILAGSLSFVGGPGTAMAWAKELEAQGLEHAHVVGLGAATLAVISGAIVSGPVTGWIVRRHGLHGRFEDTDSITFAIPDQSPAVAPPATDENDGLLFTFLIFASAILIGEVLNGLSGQTGILLPGFLSAMLAGVLITNLADVFKLKLDLISIERCGAIALQLFLVIALMATPLAAVATVLLPLAINTVVQIIVTVMIAYFVLFRFLGRDYDAAVTCGGFLGFGLSSMPVALATMDEIGRRYGPSPKAFLLITLSGSFFVDLANAVLAKAFLALPFFAFGSATGGG